MTIWLSPVRKSHHGFAVSLHRAASHGDHPLGIAKFIVKKANTIAKLRSIVLMSVRFFITALLIVLARMK
jgi:hypothetical protein